MQHADFLQQIQSKPGWERFGKYNFENNPYIDCFEGRFYVKFEELTESFQLAALVDWLDSEGQELIVVPFYHPKKHYMAEINGKMFEAQYYLNKREAAYSGILKAIELLPEAIVIEGGTK